ncbi:MAG: excinuclease ABC subunit UvrC [bacterium]
MNKPNLSPKVRELPHKPGVYIFKDRLGRIIYVGKARDLHRRVSQYFHPSRRRMADLKTRALVHSVWDLETHVVKSDPEAILLEGRLIKEYRPRYNISFRDDKRFLMLKVNLNEPFPFFQLTRLKKEDGCRYFGPFAHSGAVRATLELMQKKFHLRSCRPSWPGEDDHKHCLDRIIRNCSAPCVQKISREDYMKQVQRACEFLEGKSAEIQTELETEMKKAAVKMDFEKASRFRDMLDSVRKTTKPQRRFARQLPTTIVPERDLEELRDALQLQAIPETMECFDISNISSTHKVASMVCFRNGRPDRSHYRRYRIKTVEGQDDFASMAEVVRRRYARVLQEGWRLPDLVIVDGGMGQLSAALRELADLGLQGQPVIGLAKQREEIYLPRKAQPLLLPRTSGAIRLLQRIRDEAHRVANSYHQLLMKKRISESVLDECPGISRARKMALLRHFGSVATLRKASVEEIAQVKGVSRKLAEGIERFLNEPKKGKV